LRLKGVKLVTPAVEALDARALGRLLAAVDGPDWQDKRNVALLNVLARAGLRISEALTLHIGDVQLGDRGGAV
jgi:site-specific recombinase XerD